MSKLKNEIPVLIIALIPFAYLAFIWTNLPDRLPMHYNISGAVDRYGNKSELIFLLSILSGIGYFLFLLIPLMDPKQKLQNMGDKYKALRLITSSFLTIISLFILQSANEKGLNPKILFTIIGLFLAFLGNYFKTIKPNYFIGIKTPWTLENEVVWKKTHLMAGKLWFVGGSIIAVSYFLPNEINKIIFFLITAILVIYPILYSYLEFKKIQIK